MVNAPPTLFGQAVLTSIAPSLAFDREQRLAFLNVRTAAVQPDRRVARRYLVDCPARMVLSGGERDGRLSDLSEHGARLDTDQPPPAGTTGFLRWNGEEHYCKVIWSNEGRCGIQFDRPISRSVLEATCSHIEIAVKPVAALGRIPIGQKRSRNVTAAEVAEQARD